MWLLIPALAGIGAYVLAQEYPIVGYTIVAIIGGTVLISVLGNPAAGVSYLVLALMIVIGLVILRFIFPIVMVILGFILGIMFFYYLIMGIGQLIGG
jgi:hypothetical protein